MSPREQMFPRQAQLYLDLAFNPSVRLTLNPWHSLKTAILCRIRNASFQRVPLSGQEKVMKKSMSLHQKSSLFADSEHVRISQLPEWAWKAFEGIEKLNRIQSKLYPVAFGRDDPILLCAPTGAGKACVPLFTPMFRLTIACLD